MKITTDQAYNIAESLIRDSASTITDNSTRDVTKYTVCKDGLTLYVHAPHYEPTERFKSGLWHNKGGSISLENGSKHMFSLHTKHNVGPAFLYRKFSLIPIVTCMLSMRFFKVIDAAESRITGRLKTTDNTECIQKILSNAQGR